MPLLLPLLEELEEEVGRTLPLDELELEVGRTVPLLELLEEELELELDDDEDELEELELDDELLEGAAVQALSRATELATIKPPTSLGLKARKKGLCNMFFSAKSVFVIWTAAKLLVSIKAPRMCPKPTGGTQIHHN